MAIYDNILHNGELIPKDQACFPVYTPSLVGALGVYETILVKNGRYVALPEHLQRLFQSVEGAQLRMQPGMETLLQWAELAITANEPDGLMRILVMDLGKPFADVYFYENSYTPPTPEEYANGVAVVLYRGERAMPLVKSFNTLVPGLARKAAQAAGVHDAFLINRDGDITEGSNCNVFVVQDGALTAPPLGAALEGTVMRRVMALAAELGVPFRRRPLPVAEISLWQEVFITSTRRGVLPVRQVGDVVIGPPGPITRRLHEAYFTWEKKQLG